MKNSFFLALAIAALSAPSFAQIADNSEPPKVKFGDKLVPLNELPPPTQSILDPNLPAVPKLSVTDPAKLKLRTIETYRGPMFQLEIVRKNRADVLSSIIAAMGRRCVLEPSLSKNYYQTAVFRAFSLEELLKDVCDSSVETWKSSAGVYFFADKSKPLPLLRSLPFGHLFDRNNRPDSEVKPLIPDPNANPFIIPRGTPEEPQPKSKWNDLPFGADENL